jgi:hypothetical protein
MREKGNAYRIFVGKPEEERPLEPTAEVLEFLDHLHKVCVR